MLCKILKRLRSKDARKVAENLSRITLTVRNFAYLKQAMGWAHDPLLNGEHLRVYENLCDLNDRRLRDAEVIGGACCNGDPKILLEIGTARGRTTSLMAANAPRGLVHTVNIPPEEISAGGTLVTGAVPYDEIGSFYREAGFTNVRQIYANTKDWAPDFGPIDVALIDGCHDANFVYNDTRKALQRCRPGSLILWHDFAPHLVPVHSWIGDVCRGVERLFAEGMLRGRILHLQDSWVGLYRVPQD